MRIEKCTHSLCAPHAFAPSPFPPTHSVISTDYLRPHLVCIDFPSMMMYYQRVSRQHLRHPSIKSIAPDPNPWRRSTNTPQLFSHNEKCNSPSLLSTRSPGGVLLFFIMFIIHRSVLATIASHLRYTTESSCTLNFFTIPYS